MTAEKFIELVNLYFDREISQTELLALKAELARSPKRKEEFAERCRLHQAMRMALDPESAKRVRSGQRSQGVRPVALSTRVDDRVDVAYQGAGVPRWILGSGLAASLLIGFLVVLKAFQEKSTELAGVDAEELVEADPLDEIGRREFKRFATIQEQRSVNQRSSLAAKFRLMGLQPELTPREKHLRTVSLAALKPKISRPSQAELLEKMKNFSPMPEPRILSHDSTKMEAAPEWQAAFQTSLATFKFE